MWKSFFLFLFCVGIFSSGQRAAIADPDTSPYLLNPGAVGTGAFASLGYCNCLRWTVHFKFLGGQVESREFLVSVDSLLNGGQRYTLNPTVLSSNVITKTQEVFNFGAFEALIKGARLGVGFKGITWGKDLDLGYTNLIKSGFYALINVFRTQAARLDIRSGYDLERFEISLAPTQYRFRQPQTISFNLDTSRIKANASAGISFNRIDLSGDRQISYDVSSQIQGRLFTMKRIMASLGVEGAMHKDPYYAQFGMNPELKLVGLYIDLQYEPFVY